MDIIYDCLLFQFLRNVLLQKRRGFLKGNLLVITLYVRNVVLFRINRIHLDQAS